MNKNILQSTIRENAIYIKNANINFKELQHTTVILVTNAAKLGFGFSQNLLHAINHIDTASKKDILLHLKEIMGVDKNWTPLVKGWDEPTKECLSDHIKTLFTNFMPNSNGVKLSCGHVIPPNTFPLERYNGCPVCGTPFNIDSSIYYGQGSNIKVLELWQDAELNNYFNSLLNSKVSLDATKRESLKRLLSILPLPKDLNIEIKENQMLVIELLIENKKVDDAGKLFDNASDILRYLWYKHTGYLQIIKPKTIINKETLNSMYQQYGYRVNPEQKDTSVNKLKLKYGRQECKMVAAWLNNLSQEPKKSCEIMHPNRGMWVRFIRALRLSEYAKKEGFESLKELLDIFYNRKYSVWQGELDKAKLELDTKRYFELIKQKPSIFARNLFSTMLWFGDKETINEFLKVSTKVPARLLLTLGMYADLYFNIDSKRVVKTLGGSHKKIDANTLLALYDKDDLVRMKDATAKLFLEEMSKRYKKERSTAKTVYIDSVLDKVPLTIGDRSDSIQDLPSPNMGEKFAIEGNTIRLFMQWGVGLRAQHLDMDLSAKVIFDKHFEECSYYNLTATGCKHSGDIQRIPNMVGTAEYIELDIEELSKANAKYVIFTGNAYTQGSIEDNTTVGWMDSKHKIRISRKTGVAYDPSCVMHQIKITKSMNKGVVFGVLDVAKKEIIWLEMGFNGQIVGSLDTQSVEALLAKLNSKLSVGELLKLRAKAQCVKIVEDARQAESIYDLSWLKENSIGEILTN